MPNDYSDWEVASDPTQQAVLGNSADWEIAPEPSLASRVGTSVADIPRNLLAGAVGNIGRGASNVVSNILGPYADQYNQMTTKMTGTNPQVLDFNKLQSVIGSQNPNAFDKMAQSFGGLAPYAAMGNMGGALSGFPGIGESIGSGYANALQNPDSPVSSFLMGSIPLNAINKITGRFAAPLAKQAEAFVNPDDLAKAIHGNLLGKYNPTDSMKSLASELKDNYEAIKGARNQDYNNIFNSPVKEESYVTGEPFKAGELDLIGKNYDRQFGGQKFDDKNLQKLHDQFIDSPTIENAHRFQSELGSEVGYLKGQKDKFLLDSSGKDKLSEYATMRKTLLDDIHNRLAQSNPALSDAYGEATENWARDVVPYHSDKNLREIVQGKNTSPSPTQVAKIFGYPEDQMQRIAGNLSQEGRNNIVRSGMNVNRYQNEAKDLIRGHNNLLSKGLDQYLAPEDEQNLLNLRSNIGLQKEAENAAENASSPGAFKNALSYGKVAIPAYVGTRVLGNALGINPESLTNAMLETSAIMQGKKNALGRKK